MPGGVEIGWSGGTACTMGINARYSWSYNVGLTASHCSKKQFGMDPPSGSTSFYQPKAQLSGNRIGHEFSDPVYYTGGTRCPSGAACRYTDVLAVYYSPQTVTAYGRIAKPTGSPGYLNAGSSLTIGGYFSVIGNWDSSPVGEELHKVGRTSGWTRGYITNTCVDQHGGYVSSVGKDVYIWCTDISNIHSQGGDSGAPIFKWYGPANEVYFAGILWGGPGLNFNVTYHSSMYGIYTEFYNYVVTSTF